ncbi:MAG TPA: transglycosylase SLT domain-containing protein [Microvirga sp.]|jgi:hypothetical protein|nr:transglycosylase SLT domain-containing protein [Microvirga sp.]
MTTLTTMARAATARAPHAVVTAIRTSLAPILNDSRLRRGALYSFAAGGLVGLQIAAAGPAAVATLRPDLARLQPVAPPQPVVQKALAPRDPFVLVAILEEVFPRPEPRLAPVPVQVQGHATAEQVHEDPNEMLSFGAKSAPRWLVKTIIKAADKTGVDPVYLMTLADVESSLEPQAKAPTSSAEGLFQFIDQTWLETVHVHAATHGFAKAAEALRTVDDEVVLTDEGKRSWLLGLKRDPYFSALMAGELINDIQRELQSEGERELAEAELYLAHFFGAKAAVQFLRALDEQPDAVAAKLFPKAARANLGLFSEKKGRKRRSLTVAELYDRIDGKIIRRLNRYDAVAKQPVIPSVTGSVGASAARF